MQVAIHKLKHALDLLDPAVARKATLPVTLHVLFQDHTLRATNLEIAICVDLPEVEGPAFTLPYRLLVQTLKHVPGSIVADIQWENNVATIRAGNDTFRLNAPEAGEFPPLPVIPGDGEMVDGDQFTKELLAVVPYCAASKDTSRPVLNCACVTLGNIITLAGADGFRMAWREIPMKLTGAGTGLKEMLVDQVHVAALDRTWNRAIKPPSTSLEGIGLAPSLNLARLAIAKRMMRVRMAAGRASFQFGEATVYSQLGTGQFPNYLQLIPADPPKKITFEAGAALRVLQLLAPVASEGKNIIRLSWEGAVLQMSAHGEKMGDASSALPVTVRGGPGHIAFNARYLTDYLEGKHGLVLMESSSYSTPALFTHPGSPGTVIMPMFVADDTPKAAAPPAAAEAPTDESEPGAEPVVPEAPPKPSGRRRARAKAG